MEKISEDLRSFIYDVTLFLQRHRSCTEEQMDSMFQRAYRLYVKYDVENEQAVQADAKRYCQCAPPMYDHNICGVCGGRY